MKRLHFFVILLCITLIMLSGCKSDGFFPKHYEINNISIIRIFAIDKSSDNPENVRVTVVGKLDGESKTNENEESKKGGKAFILSCEEKTISAATRALQEYSDKILFYGHIDICLIGEQAAEKNIYEFLDFLSRDPQYRLNSSFFITKGNAYELLCESNSDEYFLPDRITNIAKNMSRLSSNYDLKILDLIRLLEDNELSALAAPVLGARSTEKEDKSPAMNAPEIEIASYAVIKSGKLVGFIEKEDMIGYNFISRKIKNPIIQVESNGGKNIALEVVDGKADIIPVIEDSELTGAVIKLQIHSNINESRWQYFSITEESVYFLEDQQNAVLYEMLMNCVNDAQEYNADFLGISNAIAHKYPKVWDEVKKDYNNMFQTLDISIEIASRIDRTYDTKDSIKGADK